MRATLRLGLICATISLVAFLKYYAGPMEIVRTQQDFVLDMMAHGARPNISPHNEKIRRQSRESATPIFTRYVSPIWQPYPPQPPTEDR